MAAESGAWWKDALGARKDRWVCAYLTAVGGGVGSTGVIKELRAALRIVKLTGAVNVVCLPVVLKELKVVHLFVKPMGAEGGVCMKVAGFARKVFMEAPTFVWPTGAERDVMWPVVRRAPGGGQIVV